MYLPASFSVALLLTVLSAVFWGSWANTYKVTRNYPFELFYWDYILGVVACSLLFALTLGSHGGKGESFIQNLQAADWGNCIQALLAGAIFNAANLLLVAAVAIAGLAVAFPIAIGIAVVEGVVLSYALQPKGNASFLAVGVLLAIAAVLFNSKAYQALSRKSTASDKDKGSRIGVIISVISGVLMGGFAPFIAHAMTHAHALTPYSVAALFSAGALSCCFIVNVYFMRHPLRGAPVSFAGYRRAGARNHLLGFLGGLLWGVGGCFNFISAGFVGVPISYAIGQSAPLIAAAWGVLAWREFTGATPSAWSYLAGMFFSYVAAIGFIAFAYEG
jgi:glucose uptake protein